MHKMNETNSSTFHLS